MAAIKSEYGFDAFSLLQVHESSIGKPRQQVSVALQDPCDRLPVFVAQCQDIVESGGIAAQKRLDCLRVRAKKPCGFRQYQPTSV